MKPVSTALYAIACASALAAPAPAATGQEPDPPPPAIPDQTPKVFLDCPNFHCDLDYFRTEIPFVNYVRDRQDADIHVLVTTQRTGAGGREFTINFIGRGAFTGTDALLDHAAAPTDTEDETRAALARAFMLGLVPYVTGTPIAERLRISYEAPETGSPAAAGPADDPWNYWVFRSRVSGNFDGEAQSRALGLFGSFSANRVTTLWKTNLSLEGRYSEREFELTDSSSATFYQHDYGADGLLVRSLGSHWSAGGRLSATSSTFLNQKLALRLAPAVEYNLFPYSESTRRQLTFEYSIGANSVQYEDTTIFDVIDETIYDQTLLVSYDVTQQWGSINTSLEGSSFLGDPSKQRLVLFANVDVRLYKGLSLNLFGSTSLLRDQVYLARGEASEEDILLRRRQLATSYRYFANVGFSYTFGSIYNNVVNSRFSGSSGGFF
ncbi:MAG: hypothetical protein ACRENI_02220 [Gemmatimonadaceae bacterium]